MVKQYTKYNTKATANYSLDELQGMAIHTFNLTEKDHLAEKVTYKALMWLATKGNMHALNKVEHMHDNTLLIGHEDYLQEVKLAIFDLCKRGYILPQEKGFLLSDIPTVKTYTSHNKRETTTEKTTTSVISYLYDVVFTTMSHDRQQSSKSQYIELTDVNGNTQICGLYDATTMGKALSYSDKDCYAILNGERTMTSHIFNVTIDNLNDLPKKTQKIIKKIVVCRMQGFSIIETANYFGISKTSVNRYLKMFRGCYETALATCGKQTTTQDMPHLASRHAPHEFTQQEKTWLDALFTDEINLTDLLPTGTIMNGLEYMPIPKKVRTKHHKKA